MGEPSKTWWTVKWDWSTRFLLAVVGAPGIVAFVGGLGDWAWIAGIVGTLSIAALHVGVQRQGGWGLLGPHHFYDVVRLARRGRSTILRVLYLVALLVGFVYVFEDAPVTRGWTQNDFARVSDRFAYTLFAVQNLAIIAIAPVYLASAIAEERERRTLELLFTTQLSDTQIVLGKLFARIIHLFGFVIAGLPILTVIQFWGGVDMVLVGGNLANTLLNILTVGSICLLISTWCKTTTTAVIVSYVVLLPSLMCCGTAGRGFPLVLQDPRQSIAGLPTVQELWVVAILHLIASGICLSFAIVSLRQPDATDGIEFPERATRPHGAPPRKLPRPPVIPQPTDPFSIPYTLPPVTDNALLWKERWVGRPLAFSLAFQLFLVPGSVLGWVIASIFIVGVLSTTISAPERIAGWNGLWRFGYYAFLLIYLIGVAYRSATTVARERQQQTLEPLLLLPIDRREILQAKLIGVLWRGWPWLILIGADVALGTLTGGFHPFSAVLLCLTPWPIILFVATLGLLFSVLMRTVLRASIAVILALALMVFGCSCGIPRPERPSFVPVFAFSASIGPEASVAHFIGSLVILALFSIGAYAIWCLAVVIFEKRVRSMEP